MTRKFEAERFVTKNVVFRDKRGREGIIRHFCDGGACAGRWFVTKTAIFVTRGLEPAKSVTSSEVWLVKSSSALMYGNSKV